MKKKPLIALLIIFSVSLFFTFNGCGHEHEYESNITPSTCTTEGYIEYVCSCGDRYTEPLPLASHNLSKAEDKASTCTEKGYNNHKKCLTCDYETYDELPLLDHQFEVVEEVKGYGCTIVDAIEIGSYRDVVIEGNE